VALTRAASRAAGGVSRAAEASHGRRRQAHAVGRGVARRTESHTATRQTPLDDAADRARLCWREVPFPALSRGVSWE
jgi:hypothetical protein